MRITLSCIKADVGGFVGHGEVHPEMLGRARELLARRWQPIPEPGQPARELVGATRRHSRGDARTLDVD